MASRILLCLFLLAFSTAAAATDRPAQYFGLSLGDYDLESDEGSGLERNFTNVGLQAGYRFSRFVAIEGRAGYSRRSSTELLERSTLHMGAAFLRIDLPFERVSLYGLAGGSQIWFGDANGDNQTESDFSGGIGVELYGSPRTAINLEYISHADRTYEGISLGFIHHFDWPSLRR